ncbi:hypothetical protein [Chamaesiphon minutus]|uniref:hypothetical protein n=1 Tax=Chamaesiphon minutus TaxID=1173032 RepID=UPI0002F6AC5A|nr:hypothetical protein [Chamaesiphon minutus]
MRSLVPKRRYQWQFPIQLKIDRCRWRLAIVLVIQPPLVKRVQIDMPSISQWFNDDD